MKNQRTHMERVVEALKILPPEPIDAKILAALIDLSPRQAGSCLSKLHGARYLAKIGTTNERYVLYIRTQKPLGRRSSSIERAYKAHRQKRGTTIAQRITKVEQQIQEIQKRMPRQKPFALLEHSSPQLRLFR